MTRLQYWASGLVFWGAVAATGCDSGETLTGGGTAGSGGTGSVCPDDPVEGPVPEACGVWVSVSKGDDANGGTQGAPVATLSHAIELAVQGPGRVYACGETWTEALTVPSGVSLHGGFDCADGWAYSGETKRARLTPPSQTAMTWINAGKTTRAWLTDFYVESIDAVEPGSSSIAVFVRDQMLLTVTRCEMVAGHGTDGLDGAPGDPADLPAASGAPGNKGANACLAPLSKGGAATESVCEGGTSTGGKGGDSSTTIAESGASGEPANPPAGEGGLGEQLSPNCTAGISGAPGKEGAFGEGGGWGAVRAGRLTTDGVVPHTGEDGKPGAPGQGGGGGGATFGITAVCGGTNSGGAAGGSGGAGGGGGRGGTGGQGGGWSVAIAMRSGDVVLDFNTFRTGNGGKGGNGGAPQSGGTGGAAAGGGKGSGAISLGCAGAMGGGGGTGGLGGGGAGGWSASIALLIGVGFGTIGEGDYFHGEGGNGGSGVPNPGNGKPGYYQQIVNMAP